MTQRSKLSPPFGYCYYFMRRMPQDLHADLKKMKTTLWRRGHHINLEQVVVQALRIGLLYMQKGRNYDR